jgi:hypothetical protein
MVGLYGQQWEAKLTIPPGTPQPEAKRLYCAWLSEHESRVEAIRKAMRGEGIDLNRRQALALAGEWYTWFVARHDDAPALTPSAGKLLSIKSLTRWRSTFLMNSGRVSTSRRCIIWRN